MLTAQQRLIEQIKFFILTNTEYIYHLQKYKAISEALWLTFYKVYIEYSQLTY